MFWTTSTRRARTAVGSEAMRGEFAVSVALEPPLVLTRDVWLDVPGRRLFVRGCEESLSPLRFEILRHLLERPGRVVSARDLVRAGVLGSASEQRYRAVMKEIRDRLGPAHDAIRTVRGAGYRFDPPRPTT